jgi:hypothetical protein
VLQRLHHGSFLPQRHTASGKQRQLLQCLSVVALGDGLRLDRRGLDWRGGTRASRMILRIDEESERQLREYIGRLQQQWLVPKKTPLFFEFSLCLSRACLGKMTVFIYQWRKKWSFSHRSDTLHEHSTAQLLC